MVYCNRYGRSPVSPLAPMRRQPKQKLDMRIFSADVSKSTVDALDGFLPIQGSRVALIRLGLEAFCSRVEKERDLISVVNQAISDMLHDDTPRGLADINPKISATLYERFNDLFPQYGANSWFLRNYLDGIVELLAESGSFDLAERAEKVVDSMLLRAETSRTTS